MFANDYDPRRDPALKRTGIGRSAPIDSRNLSSVNTGAVTQVGQAPPAGAPVVAKNGAHVISQAKFAGIPDEELIKMGRGQAPVHGGHAAADAQSEFMRRRALPLGGASPVSEADSAYKANAKLSSQVDMRENSNASAQRGYQASEAAKTEGYKQVPQQGNSIGRPAHPNPDVTQTFKTATPEKLAQWQEQTRQIKVDKNLAPLRADTAQWNKLPEPPPLTNTSNAIVGSKNGLVLPGDKLPVERIAANRPLSAEAAAHLEAQRGSPQRVTPQNSSGQPPAGSPPQPPAGGGSGLKRIDGIARNVAGKALVGSAFIPAVLETRMVANDPNATKTDVATQAASGAGKAAAGIAGAEVGAAVGTAIGGPVGTVIGGIGGGLAGYYGGDQLIKKGRESLGLDTADPVDKLRPPEVVDPNSTMEGRAVGGGIGAMTGAALTRAGAVVPGWKGKALNVLGAAAGGYAGSKFGGATQEAINNEANIKQSAVTDNPVTPKQAEVVKAVNAEANDGSANAVSGGGKGGSGTMTSSDGGSATWNPVTQKFEGVLPNGRGAINGNVNSAGSYYAPQRAQGIGRQDLIDGSSQAFDTNGQPVVRGRGAVLIGGGDLADDLASTDTATRLKAKARLRVMKEDEQRRSNDLQESGQEWTRYLGMQNLGIARQNQESNLAGNAQEMALKGLTLEQAQEVRGLQKQIGSETDPAKRRVLMDQYIALTGKSEKYQVSMVDTGDTDEYGAPIKKAIRMNTNTGEIEDLAGVMKSQPTKLGVDPKTGRMVYQGADGKPTYDDGK